MEAVLLIYLAIARLLGVKVTPYRDTIEGEPVDGWRTYEPGPVSLRIELRR